MSEVFEGWAIVELMGHNIIAGEVSEQVVAGHPFVRVDVPKLDGREPYTKMFSPTAIYAITPCGADEALEAARRINPRPVNVWVVPDRALTADDATQVSDQNIEW